MIASYLPDLAIFLAARGISKAPGTHATVISSSLTSCLTSPSTAPPTSPSIVVTIKKPNAIAMPRITLRLLLLVRLRAESFVISGKRILQTLEDLYQLDWQIKSGLVDRYYSFELFLINFKRK